MPGRKLSEFLGDDAPPLLPDGYWRFRPPDERVELFRRLRGSVPDLHVGELYRLRGRLRLAPGRPAGDGQGVRARLHSVFTDSRDPYCVFIENRSGIHYYFRVPLQDLADGEVRAE